MRGHCLALPHPKNHPKKVQTLMRHQSPHPSHRPERNHQIPALPPMIVFLRTQIEVVSERAAVGVLYGWLPVAVQSPASPEFRLAVMDGKPANAAPSFQSLVLA